MGDAYIWSAVFVAVGLAFWLVGHFTMRRPRRRSRRMEIMPADPAFKSLHEDLLSLRRRNPDLPSLPTDVSDYENWFEEALKRVRLRSVARTIEQKTRLNEKINALHGTYLKYLTTYRDIKRVSREIEDDNSNADRRSERDEDLAERRHAAERAEITLREEEANEKIEQVRERTDRRKNPPPPPPRRLTKDEKIVQIEKETADKIKQHEGNPNVQDMLRRIGEDKKMRVMEEPD